MSNDQIDQVVFACRSLRRARMAERLALIDRDRAIADWWINSGVSKAQAAAAIRTALEFAGWSEDDISLVGVSNGSVISALHPLRGN